MTTKETVKLLRQVPNLSLWGFAIHQAIKKPTKQNIDNLVQSLRSQAADNPRGMRDILGEVIYDKIIKS